jgi:hypothetical protein
MEVTNMTKVEIENEIKKLRKELDAAVETCKSMGCFVNDKEFMKLRHTYSLEQCTAHIKMMCCISELNYQLRCLAKKNHVEFTNDMLCHINLF